MQKTPKYTRKTTGVVAVDGVPVPEHLAALAGPVQVEAPAAIPGPDLKRDADIFELPLEVLEAVRRELEDEAKEEARKRRMERYREHVRMETRRRAGLLEPQVTLVIDVAGYADGVTIDGRKYFHGHQYTLPQSEADSVLEIMQRTWEHEDAVGGANRDQYRRPQPLIAGQTAHGFKPPVSPVPAQQAPIVNTSRGMFS